MIVRPASLGDIAFVMATERLPDYEKTVGRWSEAEHAAEFACAASAYLVGEEDGARVAFAILQTLDDPSGNIYLKRFAVSRQGEGIGGRMLAGLQDWVFARGDAHRLHLHYATGNERGHRLYASAGFVHEGRQREVYKMLDGTREGTFEVSMLRPEWEARRRV